jgi:hypothetical protein
MVFYIILPPCLHLFFCAGCTASAPQLPKFLPTLGEVAGKVSPSQNYFQKQKRSPKMNALKLLSLLAFAFFIFSCSNPTSEDFNAKTTDEDTPEALVIDALKNFEDVHEWILAGKPFGKQNALLKVDQVNADSTWIYGDTLTGGVGVVITERHAYPKGLLLITKNYKYGDYANLTIVSINERFVSWSQYNSGTPETKTKTELTFESAPSEAIVTHITRWTKNVQTRESYTFRNQVITIDNSRGIKTVRKAKPNDEVIVTETYDLSTNNLIQSRWTGASPTFSGGFFTRTNNYDNGNLVSWTKTTTVGQADGSIKRIIDRYP